MLEIVKAGGWTMVPILVCSVAAVAIFLERLWTLQRRRVLPHDLAARVRDLVRSGQFDTSHLQALHQSSPLGQVLAAGLARQHAGREVVKESIEDAGRHVIHDLERHLNALMTIAGVTPLLGLLGTVSGLIRAFTAITSQGVGNPTVLAGGIAEALITTAAGLVVAIPALIGYRYLRSKIGDLIVQMEKEAIKLLDTLSPQQRTDLWGTADEAQQPRKRRA